MQPNQLSAFAELKARYPITRRIPTTEFVALLRQAIGEEAVRIGALNGLSGFKENVTHVIFIVKERGLNFMEEPCGNCVCLFAHDDGMVDYELSTDLGSYWPVLRNKKSVPFHEFDGAVEGIEHFLQNGVPRDAHLYELREGWGNQRMHRYMRAEEKCEQLRRVFGYQLTASDL